MQREYDAVVVGSGPNGLAAAITLAQSDLSVLVLEANETIGGGSRSAELTLPGFLHDVCSAVHPLAVGSPFFNRLPLDRYGLKWIQPEIALAHPLDDGRSACLRRDVDETAQAFPGDAAAYRRLMQPLVRNWSKLADEFLQPMLHFPRHPMALARFGRHALWPAGFFARSRFTSEEERALFAGIAAHSFLPLEAPGSAAFGLVLGMAGHAVGWPIPSGGSRMIANALAAHLRDLGGTIETNHRVRDLRELPKCRALLFDVSVWQFAKMARKKLPAGYRRKLERIRHAPGVFKIDYALTEAVPWQAEECRRARALFTWGERWTKLPRRNAPFHAANIHLVRLFCWPSRVCSTTNALRPGQHTLWSYCHVPHGSDFDMSERIEQQIERFAPGFRDCIRARHITNARDLEKSNPNLAGGDINGGAANLWQLLARPVLSSNPYRTPLPSVYLCSSSTSPGGGVHGMCGYHAARAALRDVFDKTNLQAA